MPTDAAGRLGGPLDPSIRNGMVTNPLTGRADGCVVAAFPARVTVIGLEAVTPSWWRVALLAPHATLFGPSWIDCRATGKIRAHIMGAGPSGHPHVTLQAARRAARAA